MKGKKKFCDGCGEQRFIWKNELGKRYCKYCWSHKQTMTRNVSTRKQPLATRSLKRSKEERKYLKIRKEYLLANNLCQASLQAVCSTFSTDVHHIAGRTGDLLNDINNWMAVCRGCHDWIENHPKESIEIGYRKSKIKK